MKFFARLVCVLALVAFAAGTVAQSAGSAAMASEMITADAGVTDMGACDACDVPEAGIVGISCDFVCAAGGLAAMSISPADSVATVASDRPAGMPARTAHGFAAPPSTQPPRTFL